MARVEIVEGDLLQQEVEVIVNAWNRNIFPWWLLIPQGVSGAIRRRAGAAPFKALARMGLIPLGQAVLTDAGRLPYRAIIHVAGINLLWRSTSASIQDSTSSALALAKAEGFGSVAMPLIGAGTGGYSPAQVEAMMLAKIEASDYEGRVVLVRFLSA